MKYIKNIVLASAAIFTTITIPPTRSSAEDLYALALEISKIENFEDREKMESHARQKTIDDRFDQLSIEEKILVVRIARGMSSPEDEVENIRENRCQDIDIIDRAAALAAEDGVFFGDLTDEDMDRYVELAKEEMAGEE